MNYKFDISLPNSSDFRAELAIKGEQTFQELHEKILEILELDGSQITSFYTINKSGDRVKEITLMDMSMGEENGDTLVMDGTKIEDVINSNCIELEYVYDFFADKYLKVEYAGEYISDSADILPLCMSVHGKPPVLESSDWDFKSDGDDEDYDDSFMEEFSEFGNDGDDDDYLDDDFDDNDDGYESGGDDRYENIDDYIDQL